MVALLDAALYAGGQRTSIHNLITFSLCERDMASVLLATSIESPSPHGLYAPWYSPPSTPGVIKFAQVYFTAVDYTNINAVLIQNEVVWHKPSLAYGFWISNNDWYAGAVPVEFEGIVLFPPAPDCLGIYVTNRPGTEFYIELWGDAAP